MVNLTVGRERPASLDLRALRADPPWTEEQTRRTRRLTERSQMGGPELPPPGTQTPRHPEWRRDPRVSGARRALQLRSMGRAREMRGPQECTVRSWGARNRVEGSCVCFLLA